MTGMKGLIGKFRSLIERKKEVEKVDQPAQNGGEEGSEARDGASKEELETILSKRSQTLKKSQRRLAKKDRKIESQRSKLDKLRSAADSTRERLVDRDQKIKAQRSKLGQLRDAANLAQERSAEKDQVIEVLRSRLTGDGNATDSANSSERSAPVFFLVGHAKSGTSWLMRTFDAHPEILCKGEGRIFGRDYKREDIKRMPSKTLQPSSLHRAILDADYLNAWIERSVWTRDDEAEEHLIKLTRVAANYFLTERLAKSGKRIVGDKTPFLSEEIIGEIGEIYPEAKIIHIIRDGRDVAVSSIHHLWNHSIDLGGHLDLKPEERAMRDAYREDPRKLLERGEGIFTEDRIRHLAESWSTQVSRAMEDGSKLLGENYAEVRYEDLLERPEQEAGRLIEFLGAEASEETVGLCVNRAGFERWAKGRKPGEEDSSAFLRKGVAGDWRNVFTEEDKRIFKEVAGQMLIRLGYENDGDW